MEDLLLILLGQTVVIVGSLGGLIIYLSKNTEKRIGDKLDKLIQQTSELIQQISEANERARFASMERELAGLKADVSGLRADVSGLKTKFSGMDGKVDSLHSIIAPKLELKEA